MYHDRVGTVDRFVDDLAVIFRGAKRYLKNVGKIQEKYRKNTGKYRESPGSFFSSALTLLENAETEWATRRWFAARKLVPVNYVARMNCWADGLLGQ